METKFFLVRHGQSIGNLLRVYLGHTDLGLSELGLLQAEKTAEALSGEKIDLIYSSDLKRAYETALPHAKIRGLSVQTSPELRELYIGKWEGAKISDLERDFYDEFVLGWLGDFGNFTFPGGESVLAGGERLYREIKKIAEENPGKTVLIAAHAAVIKSFWCKISKIHPDDMASAVPIPTNASYSTFVYDGVDFIPEKFSCDDHLKDEK